jgi:hypothetical protein
MYDNENEPLPINYDKQMENKNKLNNIIPKNDTSSSEEELCLNNYYKYISKNYSKILTQDIVIYTILFLLLNNKFVINLLYNILLVARYDKYHVNLLIRAGLFLLSLYLIKTKLLNAKK